MSRSYVPGVCNIGAAETARRRDSGLAGTAAGVAALAALIGFGAPRPLRLLAALPLAGGAAGLLQARLRFCAGFGVLGRSNFAALGETETVEDAEDRAADRRRALQILAASGAIGGGLAALSLLLPATPADRSSRRR